MHLARDEDAMRTAALYAGLLGLMLIALTFSVADGRRRARVALGDGGDELLRRRIRAHGNFIEYVPLTLLLLALSEHLGLGSLYVHILGIALVVARAIHAFGISQTDEPLMFRLVGTTVTLVVLAIVASYCVYIGLLPRP
jgi:uncharacterized membrane protein YecN with MAPEG domain